MSQRLGLRAVGIGQQDAVAVLVLAQVGLANFFQLGGELFVRKVERAKARFGRLDAEEIHQRLVIDPIESRVFAGLMLDLSRAGDGKEIACFPIEPAAIDEAEACTANDIKHLTAGVRFG